jgi:hypothetical protein
VGRDPPVNPNPRSGTSDPYLEERLREPRMIYGTEAKSYHDDDARINTLKDDTDASGVLIFVRSYSVCAHHRRSHANVSMWYNRLVYFPPR